MKTNQQRFTRNIRVPSHIHEQLKHKCKMEGLLMGAFVEKLIIKAIAINPSSEFTENESSSDSNINK